MEVVAKYSHLNGLEFLQVHKPELWEEILTTIYKVKAEDCKTKVSREQRKKGKVLYSPSAINSAFKQELTSMGWEPSTKSFYVTHDEDALRQIVRLQPDQQKEELKRRGLEPIYSFNQTDFLKNRVAVEVQMGKYAFVAHDIFVKHHLFYDTNAIDVGIEIVVMKSMLEKMSSGIGYYERDLMNIIRQGRGFPAVPLVLVGIKP